MKAFCSEFGLSPVSRARLFVERRESDGDDLMALLTQPRESRGESWLVDKPIEYARSARLITQAAVDKVAASIKKFGFRQPIVVDKKGVIIVGHVRLRAAKKLGLTHVPVASVHE
ncbi:MAG: ParB N-terminal domain-containing protein [Bryobacteraceae bacterium]